IELAPEHPGLRPRRPRLRVDPDALQRRQVDHQPSVAERMPGNAVTTETNRDQQIALAREAHGRNHVCDACAAGDAGGAAVDRAVPYSAGSIVTRARRQQELATEGFR